MPQEVPGLTPRERRADSSAQALLNQVMGGMKPGLETRGAQAPGRAQSIEQAERGYAYFQDPANSDDIYRQMLNDRSGDARKSYVNSYLQLQRVNPSVASADMGVFEDNRSWFNMLAEMGSTFEAASSSGVAERRGAALSTMGNVLGWEAPGKFAQEALGLEDDLDLWDVGADGGKVRPSTTKFVRTETMGRAREFLAKLDAMQKGHLVGGRDKLIKALRDAGNWQVGADLGRFAGEFHVVKKAAGGLGKLAPEGSRRQRWLRAVEGKTTSRKKTVKQELPEGFIGPPGQVTFDQVGILNRINATTGAFYTHGAVTGIADGSRTVEEAMKISFEEAMENDWTQEEWDDANNQTGLGALARRSLHYLMSGAEGAVAGGTAGLVFAGTGRVIHAGRGKLFNPPSVKTFNDQISKVVPGISAKLRRGLNDLAKTRGGSLGKNLVGEPLESALTLTIGSQIHQAVWAAATGQQAEFISKGLGSHVEAEFVAGLVLGLWHKSPFLMRTPKSERAWEGLSRSEKFSELRRTAPRSGDQRAFIEKAEQAPGGDPDYIKGLIDLANSAQGDIKVAVEAAEKHLANVQKEIPEAARMEIEKRLPWTEERIAAEREKQGFTVETGDAPEGPGVRIGAQRRRDLGLGERAGDKPAEQPRIEDMDPAIRESIKDRTQAARFGQEPQDFVRGRKVLEDALREAEMAGETELVSEVQRALDLAREPRPLTPEETSFIDQARDRIDQELLGAPIKTRIERGRKALAGQAKQEVAEALDALVEARAAAADPAKAGKVQAQIDKLEKVLDTLEEKGLTSHLAGKAGLRAKLRAARSVLPRAPRQTEPKSPEGDGRSFGRGQEPGFVGPPRPGAGPPATVPGEFLRENARERTARWVKESPTVSRLVIDEGAPGDPAASPSYAARIATRAPGERTALEDMALRAAMAPNPAIGKGRSPETFQGELQALPATHAAPGPPQRGAPGAVRRGPWPLKQLVRVLKSPSDKRTLLNRQLAHLQRTTRSPEELAGALSKYLDLSELPTLTEIESGHFKSRPGRHAGKTREQKDFLDQMEMIGRLGSAADVASVKGALEVAGDTNGLAALDRGVRIGRLQKARGAPGDLPLAHARTLQRNPPDPQRLEAVQAVPIPERAVSPPKAAPPPGVTAPKAKAAEAEAPRVEAEAPQGEALGASSKRWRTLKPKLQEALTGPSGTHLDRVGKLFAEELGVAPRRPAVLRAVRENPEVLKGLEKLVEENHPDDLTDAIREWIETRVRTDDQAIEDAPEPSAPAVVDRSKQAAEPDPDFMSRVASRQEIRKATESIEPKSPAKPPKKSEPKSGVETSMEDASRSMEILDLVAGKEFEAAREALEEITDADLRAKTERMLLRREKKKGDLTPDLSATPGDKAQDNQRLKNANADVLPSERPQQKPFESRLPMDLQAEIITERGVHHMAENLLANKGKEDVLRAVNTVESEVMFGGAPKEARTRGVEEMIGAVTDEGAAKAVAETGSSEAGRANYGLSLDRLKERDGTSPAEESFMREVVETLEPTVGEAFHLASASHGPPVASDIAARIPRAYTFGNVTSTRFFTHLPGPLGNLIKGNQITAALKMLPKSELDAIQQHKGPRVEKEALLMRRLYEHILRAHNEWNTKVNEKEAHGSLTTGAMKDTYFDGITDITNYYLKWMKAAIENNYNVVGTTGPTKGQVQSAKSMRSYFRDSVYMAAWEKHGSPENKKVTHDLLMAATGKGSQGEYPRMKDFIEKSGWDRLWRAMEVEEGVLTGKDIGAQAGLHGRLHARPSPKLKSMEAMHQEMVGDGGGARMSKAEAKEITRAWKEWDWKTLAKHGIHPPTQDKTQGAGELRPDKRRMRRVQARLAEHTGKFEIDPTHADFIRMADMLDSAVPQIYGKLEKIENAAGAPIQDPVLKGRLGEEYAHLLTEDARRRRSTAKQELTPETYKAILEGMNGPMAAREVVMEMDPSMLILAETFLKMRSGVALTERALVPDEGVLRGKERSEWIDAEQQRIAGHLEGMQVVRGVSDLTPKERKAYDRVQELNLKNKMTLDEMLELSRLEEQLGDAHIVPEARTGGTMVSAPTMAEYLRIDKKTSQAEPWMHHVRADELLFASMMERSQRSGLASDVQWIEKLLKIQVMETSDPGSRVEAAAKEWVANIAKMVIPEARRQGWLVETKDGMMVVSLRINKLASALRYGRVGHKRDLMRDNVSLWGEIDPIKDWKCFSPCMVPWNYSIRSAMMDAKIKDNTFGNRIKQMFMWGGRGRGVAPMVAHFAEDYLNPQLRKFHNRLRDRLFATDRNQLGDKMATFIRKHKDAAIALQDKWLMKSAVMMRDAGLLLSDNITKWKDPSKMNAGELHELHQRKTLTRVVENKQGVETLDPKFREIVPKAREIYNEARKEVVEHIFSDLRYEAERALKSGSLVPEWAISRKHTVTFRGIRDPKTVLKMIDMISDLPVGKVVEVTGANAEGAVESVMVRGWGREQYAPHMWPKTDKQGDGTLFTEWSGSDPDANRVVKVDNAEEFGEWAVGMSGEKWRFMDTAKIGREHGIIRRDRVMRNLFERLEGEGGYHEDFFWITRNYMREMTGKISHERMSRELEPTLYGEWTDVSTRTAEEFMHGFSNVPRESDVSSSHSAMGGLDPHFGARITGTLQNPEVRLRGSDGSYSKYKPDKRLDRNWISNRNLEGGEIWRTVPSETVMRADPKKTELTLSNGPFRVKLTGLEAIKAAGIQVRQHGILNLKADNTGAHYAAISKYLLEAMNFDVGKGKFVGNERSASRKWMESVADSVNELFYHSQLGGVVNPKAMGVQLVEGIIQNFGALGVKPVLSTIGQFGGYWGFKRHVISAKDPLIAYQEAKVKFAHTRYVKEVLPILEKHNQHNMIQLLDPQWEGGARSSKGPWKRAKRLSFMSFQMADVYTKELGFMSTMNHLKDVSLYVSPYNGRSLKLTDEAIPPGEMHRRGSGFMSKADIALGQLERSHFTIDRHSNPGVVKMPGWKFFGHLGTQATLITLNYAYEVGSTARFLKHGRPEDLWSAQKMGRYATGLFFMYWAGALLDRDMGAYTGAHIADVGLPVEGGTLGDYMPWLRAAHHSVRLPAFQLPHKIGMPAELAFGKPGIGLPRTAADSILRVASGDASVGESIETSLLRMQRHWFKNVGIGPFTRMGRPGLAAWNAKKSDLDPERPYEIRDPAFFGTEPRTRYRDAWDLYFADIFLPGWSYRDSLEHHRAKWLATKHGARGDLGRDLRQELRSQKPEIRNNAMRKLKEKGFVISDSRERRRMMLDNMPSTGRLMFNPSVGRRARLEQFAEIAHGWSAGHRALAWRYITGQKPGLFPSGDAGEEIPTDLKRRALAALRSKRR